MSFSIHGSPIVDFSDEIKSKKVFEIYLSTWLNFLNFQTYKRNFTKDLRIYNKNEVEVNYNDNEYFKQQYNHKNDFIKLELKSIQSILKVFDKFYSHYNIGEYNKGSSSENLTSEKETFIVNYKNLNDAPMKQSAFLLEYIKCFEYKQYFQWVDIMYLDVLKTKDYLTSLFMQDLKVSSELNQKKQQGVINENQHPNIFDNGAFDIFVKWVKNSNDEQVKSISFIFQKLKKENKLRNTTFKVLSEWAFNNNYLNEESYNKLLTNGCFISPSKILTKTRLVLYNSIIGN